MRGLLHDLRFAVRTLLKNRAFTVVVIVTLALGIGANTAIFTLIDAVMLRSLPVAEPGRLVLFSDDVSEGTLIGDQFGRWRMFSYASFRHFRENNDSFADVCVFRKGEEGLRVRLEGSDATHLAQGKLVSGNYFSVLGVRAVAGRTLSPQDDTERADRTAVISYGYWQRRFNRDSSAVGRTAYLNGVPFTIVGVTPAEFFGETWRRPPDMWLPMVTQPVVMARESFLTRSDTYWLNLIGRLKPGVDRQQAETAVNVQLRQFLTRQAGSEISANRRRDIEQSRIDLAPGGIGISLLRFRYSRPLHILMAAVGLMLLIACANIANLLLSRAAARQKEMSVRLALGATRARLVRQLLTESLLLAGVGGVAALLLAGWVVRLLIVQVAGASNPLSTTTATPALLFTLGVCTVTAILFGFAPALAATAPLHATATARTSWATKALVAGQIALSLPLLIGATLLVRSLQNLQQENVGFDRDNVLLMQVSTRQAGYKPDQLARLYQDLLDRISAVPGVQAATIASYSPISGTSHTSNISIQGHTPRPGQNMDVQLNRVAARFFETLRTPVLIGRAIGPQDTDASPKVAVISESFALEFFPGQTPIGKRFNFGSPGEFELEIVGVAGGAKYNNLRERPPRMVFVPVLQTDGQERYAGQLIIRSAGDGRIVAADVRRAIAEVDKTLPILNVTTLGERISQSLTQERTVSRLSSLFAGLALLLSSFGLYGLMAYTVARKTSEIGIRIALGAGRRHVVALVLGQGMRIVATGLVIGLAAALALTRALSTLLFGIGASDPLTYAGVVAVLAIVALAANYFPARRASRVDPMVALRYE